MRVLHIETGRHLYGGALQVRYLLEGLRTLDVDNILVCPRGSDIAAAAQPFATVCESPMAGDLDGRFFFSLVQAVRKTRPDLIHVHSRRGADLWGPVAAGVCRIPAVLTRRVDNLEPTWWVNLKYRSYEKIVTISEGIRRVLLEEGVPREKTVCIPSAVDAEIYRQACDRNWFHREFSLPPDARSIGVIAQLIERKGHRYLVEAAPQILRTYPQVRFIFFGQGPLREELVRLCKEARLLENVIFAGFREDLPKIIPCLDLVVHPALMEGLGVSLLQAAAAGVPIVAAAAGGIPEIVRDGINGFLFPPGDAEALAEKTCLLLSNPDMCEQFASRGEEIVSEEFSIQAMVQGNMGIYLDILREGKNNAVGHQS